MNLRQSMSGLHTWSGLLVSWLLFVIVFAGSLASFDKELTRWMQPDLHLPGAQSLGADQVRDWLRQRAPDAHAWWMLPPSARAPYWNAGWEPRDGSEFKAFQLDAVSGQPLPKTVGGEFFFTLHYDLHAGMVGLYIVGIAGMLMLVALVSGTIVHRRIFKDFFTLRPQAARQRAWLDAHNVLGVIGLPFHLMIAYTGLVIFIVYYMQAGLQVVYQNDGERFFHEVQGSYEREEVGRPAGPPASIDGLIVEAGKVWADGGAPGWISVHHPYDEAATVDIRRRDASRILDDQRTVNFDASSGELLHAQPSYALGYATYGWLTGLHMIQWGGQLVRWMYLLLAVRGDDDLRRVAGLAGQARGSRQSRHWSGAGAEPGGLRRPAAGQPGAAVGQPPAADATGRPRHLGDPRVLRQLGAGRAVGHRPPQQRDPRSHATAPRRRAGAGPAATRPAA